jgi:membrane-bound lytic murein transglycosylase B
MLALMRTHPMRLFTMPFEAPLLASLFASLFAALLCVAPAAHAASGEKSKPYKASPYKAPTYKAPKHATIKPGKAMAAPAPAYGDRDDVVAFAGDLAERRKLPREWLLTQLSQARRMETVRKLVMPPPAGTAKNWAAYRARFVEPQRINAGLQFWRDNEAWLLQAEERFGVPASVVVAIVGVETYYGRHTGSFRVLDALSTLAFDFPPGRKDRSAFFRSELEEFFVFCAREAVDPQQQRGSFAGAMGLPQFMPSSINRIAFDLDGDGHINLLNSSADVVGSVARFLADAGWQRNMPTHYDVAVPVNAADRATLLGPDILPSFSAAQFNELGAQLSNTGRAHIGPLALVELQNGDLAPSYVAGTQNFYTVTRYNWSSYYALAVIELAQALAQGRAVAAATR